MPRKLDPVIAEVLKKYGADPTTSCWDCHGTWVVYHKALEAVAARAGIAFDPPTMLQMDAEKKIAAMCVTGRLGERSEWSIGEAAPYNNKNSYPFAMSEKRAKDRVILKLIGLHGLAYSEEEADDFQSRPEKPKEEAPKNAPGVMAAKTWAKEHIADLHSAEDGDDFMAKLDAEKGHWVRACAKYPGVWEGPENSGLVNDGAAAAAVYDVRDRFDKFVSWVETKAAEVE